MTNATALPSDSLEGTTAALVELPTGALETLSGGRRRHQAPFPHPPAPPSTGEPQVGICIYIPGFRNPCNRRPPGVP
jgi:hypothetical protein